MFDTHPFYQEDIARIVNSAAMYGADLTWLNGKSFLITGATGLICSFLIDVLMFCNINHEGKIHIYALGRNKDYAYERFMAYWNHPQFSFIQHDISRVFNYDIRADYIIHGASNAYPASFAADPVGTMKSNIFGTYNLLEFSIRTGAKRLLYVSSGEVYGEGTGQDFVESYSGYIDNLNPRACYPISKRAAETLCVSYKDQYGIDAVIARPCHIYGPTMTKSDNRAFAQFIRNVLERKDIVLKSDGRQYRSYCYAADCASALLAILFKGVNGEAYNIADKKSNITIKQLAETIARTGGRKIVFDIPSTQEQKGYSVISRAVLDATKLENLGWRALFNVEEGIRRTFQILGA